MKHSLIALLGITILIMPAESFAGDCGHANDDGLINLLDVTYLINYLYREGPPPYCGCGEIVTDIDGNSYQTIQIGDQCWMMENLKVTHYRNGDPIRHVTDGWEWHWLLYSDTGAYCNYDNDEGHVAVYGRLYNWYAANDSRNIAPEGWHVPTDADWQTLIDFLGGDVVAGGKLKEAGTVHWESPNTGATNVSGFTALPGGGRFWEGEFAEIDSTCYFSSSTEQSDHSAWMRRLRYNDSEVFRGSYSKAYGLSIRCVKD